MKYILLAALLILNSCSNKISIKDTTGISRMSVLFSQRMEGTPVVFKEQLLYIVSNRNSQATIEIYDESKTLLNSIDTGTHFPSALVIDDELYIFSTRGLTSIEYIKTADLTTFSAPTTVFTAPPEMKLYNTSVAASPNGFVMSYETCEPDTWCFSVRFLESQDLINWHAASEIFSPDAYAACPTIRYSDGFYYMFYLRTLSNKNTLFFETVLVRSTDLVNWSQPKVVMFPNGEGTNNSDFDLVEYKGQTIIQYADGDQVSDTVNIRGAIYSGTLDQFLKSFF